jgi:dolichol-phosphate mannosyltransferase
MNEPVFSIIAPIYNELNNLPLLYSRVQAVMAQTGEPWELILVDDGSQDGSTEVIRQLAREDERVRPIIFARNFGHQIAVTAGMDYCQGQAAVVIDADLQDPPEVILQMIEKWRQGYQVVYAVRTEREGESWFKKTTASWFYRMIDKITDVRIPLDTGDFRLIDRKVLDVLNQMRERNRFLRGMGAWVGFKQIGVEYKRAARYSGTSHYPLKKMLKLALNAVTSFSVWPLQMLLTAGLGLAGLSVLLLIVFLILALAANFDLTWVLATWLTVIFLAGVLLAGMGILGEYIGRIYDEAKGRPLYIVAEGPQDGPEKVKQSTDSSH